MVANFHRMSMLMSCWLPNPFDGIHVASGALDGHFTADKRTIFGGLPNPFDRIHLPSRALDELVASASYSGREIAALLPPEYFDADDTAFFDGVDIKDLCAFICFFTWSTYR